MRTILDKQKIITFKDKLLLNCYYALSFFRYLGIVVIVFGLIVAAILFVLHQFVPEKLEIMDRIATHVLFNKLQESGEHHQAIAIMEYKGRSILYNDYRDFEYKLKLSDSYVAVGDYHKAEKLLLDVWNDYAQLKDSLYKDAKKEDFEGEPFEGANSAERVNATTFGLSRTLYQLYEKMGDKSSMKKFFTISADAYHKSQNLINYTPESYDSKHFSGLRMNELVERDSIVIVSLDDKEKAILLMKNYIDKIIEREDYNLAFKVMCLSSLIGWELEQNKKFDAYRHIYQATALTKLMRTTSEYKALGDLSDYLLEIHDIPLSKSICIRYQKYLDENYSKTDYEYLKNQIRLLHFYKIEGNNEKLTEGVMDYCSAMKKHILTNIQSMTEDQRELIVKEFDLGYDMAFQTLQKYPSKKIANLCFENVAFKNGLLLRSDTTFANQVAQSNDKEVIKKYNELKNCQKELAYQSASLNIFNKKNQLKNRIDSLEKDLALKFSSFKTAEEIKSSTIEDIQKALCANEAVAILSENNGALFSLVLKSKGDVEYDFVGYKKDVEDKLANSIDELYSDEKFTNYIWSKTARRTEDCSTVYYQPLGMFAQISPAALYAGHRNYLCDKWNFVLIGNPADVISMNLNASIALNNKPQNASLWGGIDYGDNENIVPSQNVRRSAITRGEKLVNLNYALAEVKGISNDLQAHSYPYTINTGQDATEKKFKTLSGKQNKIIHISTHGFFNDKGSRRNTMLESGLFFAGSNPYWTNDSINFDYSDDDGILRAAEIAQMNLTHCSLVVLSACETGLGFNDSSEGIYGLQRAFKLAGVKQILMSLWDVDDRATALLMTEFYRNLLKGNDANKALLLSQKKLRQDGFSPESWGAFVLLN